MDELVDILDKKGHYTGKSVLKSEAHKKGLFHPTVHIWCYSETGKILLQQRGANKKTFPLKWDVSVAGHMASGETPEVSALREVQEEIGVVIDLSKLEKIGVEKIEKKHSEAIWDREFTTIFLYPLEEDVPLVKQVSEVEALQWITLAEFEELVLKKDERFVPNSTERYIRVINKLKSRI